MKSKQSRITHPPVLSVVRFRTHSAVTTLTLIILILGLFGVGILLWLEFTNPKLLESAVTQFENKTASV